MKRIIGTFLLFFVVSGSLFAQDKGGLVYQKGQKDLNIGVGLGSFYGLPIGASLDYGYTDKISIGGYVGYATKTEEMAVYNSKFKWNYTAYLVGARGAYHFYNTNKIDAYGGLMLGYYFGSVKFEGTGSAGIPEPEYGGIAYSGFIGGRYRFTDKFGAFAELGYGIAYLQVGLTMKL